MDGLNEVKLIGHVGKDVDLRHLDDDRKVARVVLATNKTYKKLNGEKETKTEWHDIEFWNGKAQFCSNYIKKGMKLYISGELRNDVYEKDGVKHYKVKIVGDNVIILSDRASNSNGAQSSNHTDTARQQSEQYVAEPTSVASNNFVQNKVDEDLPF